MDVGSSIVKCAQFICYNFTAEYNTRLRLLSTDESKVLYTSSFDIEKNEMGILKVSDAGIAEGTQFKFGITSPVFGEQTLEQIFQYELNSNTMYYQIGNNANFDIVYIDTVASTNLPPVLPCCKISAQLRSSLTDLKFYLETLTGEKIYTSDKITLYEFCNIDFRELNIMPGVRLLLKDGLSAKDSSAYIILEYSPDNDDTAYFYLRGNVFNTALEYIGRRGRIPE